jgi:hypothetical protein
MVENEFTYDSLYLIAQYLQILLSMSLLPIHLAPTT